MRLIISSLFILSYLAMSACSIFHVHQVEIQQGNIITKNMIAQLKPGMTKQQVLFLLGTPVLINTFRDNRYHYVYTLQKSYNKIAEKKLTLYFKNDTLERFTTTGVDHKIYIKPHY